MPDSQVVFVYHYASVGSNKSLRAMHPQAIEVHSLTLTARGAATTLSAQLRSRPS